MFSVLVVKQADTPPQHTSSRLTCRQHFQSLFEPAAFKRFSPLPVVEWIVGVEPIALHVEESARRSYRLQDSGERADGTPALQQEDGGKGHRLLDFKIAAARAG